MKAMKTILICGAILAVLGATFVSSAWTILCLLLVAGACAIGAIYLEKKEASTTESTGPK